MKKKQDLPAIGWREWLSLPELGIVAVKAKIDTGARSSAIHAFDLQTFSSEDKYKVRFKVHPYQRNPHTTVISEAEILEEREVRNSGGHTELRLTIVTLVVLGGSEWPIELTLTNRDVMGFRMLLGRQAVRDRFLVNPGKSYLLSRNLSPTGKKQVKRIIV
ncbi:MULTISPECIES: ATP-dependent zinc protease family protein [Planktothricoides]|uniref:RimK/LysX family protein n=2 Tax=Planktothricoides raciborskii TaxID=132608 RepID=A0AAU8JCR2_9CYAN|nr:MULTISPECIES: RimK/LysX family protein [Planktothricoides]KOR37272.1 aspartyl protease [Planktothricoides sp. SR001]MBD2542391.1 ATP-dependent zinc protease [Planktothricoides raciborskii FACHB-1370]MBD2582059.1 ATP-dependent zinc protease [Planktothricoides raciborskii FACHB-1261]